MLFRLTAGTNVGCVRSNNEDNFIVNDNLEKKDWFVPGDVSKEISLGKNGAILVVADGMGGMNAGEVASAIAIDTITSIFSLEDYSKITVSDKKIGAFLKDAIVEADSRIKAKVKEDESTAGMGTTIVIAWVLEGRVHVAWCGDSRGYIFNAGSGLVRITKDHSYVQELVDAGKLDAELAFDHPNSNIITRSLGDSPVKAQPDYISRTLSDGDYILLCSDGLCGLCRDEEILQVMAASEDIESCKNALIKAALEAGGYDNVTVALLEVVSAGNEEVEAVADDTTNDFKNVKRRKRRNRLISALAIIVLLAGCAWWLHYTGRLSSILQSVSDKLELYLEDSSQPAAVEEEVQELEAAPDTVKVDTINIQ